VKREAITLAVIGLMFVALSLPAQAQVSFFQPPLYAGSGNQFVADFNGDGKPDILTSDGTLNLGNGDGAFTLGTSLSGTSVPVLAVADFNGDGKPDVLEQGTGTLLVLLGNGDGTFQAPISTASGASLGPVAATDLNGDGKADVVGVFGSSLMVYISNGNGTLASGVSYSLGTTSSGAPLSLGDFNDDGNTDVVVSIGGGDNLAGQEIVLLGNGDGTFQTTPKTSAGVYLPQYAAVGDFNGDGKLDLAVSSNEYCNGSCTIPATTYVLLGNGDGTFGGPTVAFLGEGPLAAADLNGDGKLDLVLVPSTNPVSGQIYLGNGDGTFSNTGNDGISIGGAAISSIATADFNGDGNLDIAAGGVILGNGDGTFRDIQLGVVPSGSYPPSPFVAGDFEKKGALDVAALSTPAYDSSNSLYILSNNGSGALSLIHTYTLQENGVEVVPGDFNGDGNLDLVVVGADPTTENWSYSVLLGNGDGSFQPPVYYPQSVAGGGAAVVADFNNDHNTDLAVSAGDGSVAILLGNGDGTFAPPVYYYSPGGVEAVADFNGDGKLDIAAGIAISQPPPTTETGILYGNGDGTFQPVVFPATLNGFAAAYTADFNNDGKPDLLSGNQVALGNGDGTFTLLPPLSQTGILNFYVSAIADFNGDGKLDLLGTTAIDHPEGTGILLGNGDGTFGSFINILTSAGSGVLGGPVLIADMNGDGQADIVFPWVNVIGGGTLTPPIPTALGVLLNTTQVISPQPDFRITASGLSPTPVTAGNSAASTLTLAPLNGFNGNVALSCSGLATGLSCSFNPPSVAGGSGASTLTVTTTSGLAAGNYTVIVSGVSGSLSHIAALTLTVESGTTVDFQISATAASPATVAPGSSATSTVTVAAVDGFNSAVALTCDTGVSAVTCSLNPTSATPSGSMSPTSTLTINTTTSATPGAYSVTLYGTSGSDVHSTGVTLTVQASPPNFTIGAASGSPTSQTVSAGQTANFSLALAPTGSFTGTVNLSCAITPVVTPAPTCGLSSSSVQVSGSSAQTVTVNVATTAPGTAAATPPVNFPPGAMPLMWSFMLLGSTWLWVRNHKRLTVLAAPIVLLAVTTLVSCGGSGSSSTHTTPGTPPGTYAVTITATAGSISNNVALQVVVQ
jgi:hypothetical protein